MLTQHIALVPEADGVSASDLARVSAALQKQVTRDLTPSWGISATVDTFPRLDDIPLGYWPIVIGLCELGREAGIHLDENGQPYAQVQAHAGSLQWSLAASRACLEMLVNPHGDRTVTAPSPHVGQGLVEFMLDVTGPCAAHSYTINEVIVSDFCTPDFFDFGTQGRGARYSFCGQAQTPFELLPGGHLTWLDPVSNRWWLRSHWEHEPVDTELGFIDRRLVSVRELVRARQPVVGKAFDPLDQALEASRRSTLGASQARAHRLRTLLGARLDAQMWMDFDPEEERAPTRPPPELSHGLSIVTDEAPHTFDGLDAPFVSLESLDLVSDVTELETDAEAAREPVRAQLLDEDDQIEQGIEALYDVQEEAGPPVRSPYDSFAPIDVPTFGDPPGAGRRMGLIFSGIAGALLVLWVWGAQVPIVKSAANGKPGVPAVATQPAKIEPQVPAVAPRAPAQLPSYVIIPLAEVPPLLAASEVAGAPSLATTAAPRAANDVSAQVQGVRERRRARRALQSMNEDAATTRPARRAQAASSLDDLVDTRR